MTRALLRVALTLWLFERGGGGNGGALTADDSPGMIESPTTLQSENWPRILRQV